MTERHFKKCIQETDTDKLKAIREEWMNLILFAHSQPLDRRTEQALRKMCKLSTAIEEELTRRGCHV